MADQFEYKGMARGTKLMVQHVQDPLSAIQTALEDATVAKTTECLAPFRMTFNVPYMSSVISQDTNGASSWYYPFVCPPFQEEWTVNYQPPVSTVFIRELTVSFDQRGEPYGIADQYCDPATDEGGLSDFPPSAPTPGGYIPGNDASRYDLTITLFEHPLYAVNSDTSQANAIWSVFIPGQEAFGNYFFRQNPLQLPGLNIPLHPYRAYSWSFYCPGLHTLDTTKADNLALPNFTVSAKGVYPLSARDVNVGDPFVNPTVQNLPIRHQGNPATGSMSVPTLVGDAIIDGDSDLQTTFRAFDQVELNKLKSGYGSDIGGHKSIGMESDTFPWEQLQKDAAYSMIVVPMWGGWEDLRAGDAGMAEVPYTNVATTDPTIDRRLIRVPTGFVLHHAIAAWVLTSPVSDAHATWGDFPSSGDFYNRIGIGLCNGLRGDDYHYQQIAYLEYNGVTYTNWRIAEYQRQGISCPEFVLLNIPLNNPAAPLWQNKSYTDSGPPVYMGGGNSNTSDRTFISALPSDNGGAPFLAPATRGGENFLEVRWEMEDSVNGLNDAGHPNHVRTGINGFYVILVGKQSVGS